MSAPVTATAFAPASIGNVAVGFDMLGLAVEGIGDRVAARRERAAGVAIERVFGPDGRPHPDLPADPARNTAAIAAAAVWRLAGAPGGLAIDVYKGIPLQSGMGSSAASAVAAAVASNALLEAPLAEASVLQCALEGERFASGGLHADNVAPSLFGGLVLCPPVLLPDVVRLKAPPGIVSVLLHPQLRIDTASSRRGLARGCTMEQWLAQQGYLAGFVVACERQDAALMRKSLRDVVIEPQRADSVPCFAAVKEAALAADAFGCSLSGSGPAMFALCGESDAAAVAAAMEEACRASGTACESWVSRLTAAGAHVERAA